jgi:hypothetical protein
MREYKMIQIMLASAFLAGCNQTAGTEAISGTRNTLPGRSQKLDHFTTLNADCTTHGSTVVRVAEPPANGRIVISSGLDYPSYSRENQRYECNKRRVPGVAAVYVPNAGFSGNDRVVIETIFGGGTRRNTTYTVVVR